jgi:hypothetical protein
VSYVYKVKTGARAVSALISASKGCAEGGKQGREREREIKTMRATEKGKGDRAITWSYAAITSSEGAIPSMRKGKERGGTEQLHQFQTDGDLCDRRDYDRG